MRVRVKICGVRRLADARAAVVAGADFLGLNFHPPSPRYLEPEAAVELAAALPGVALVGVFVDAPRARVEDIAARVGLTALQFSGDEDPAYCTGWPWRTMKALRLGAGVDGPALASRYATDYLMVDTLVPGMMGGTGVALMLLVSDVDAFAERAVAAGATLFRAPRNEPHGDRAAILFDPFGHRWFLATPIEQLSTREIQERVGRDFKIE